MERKMTKTEVAIVVNPGSTSTKFAIFSREGSLYEETVRSQPGRQAATVKAQSQP